MLIRDAYGISDGCILSMELCVRVRVFIFAVIPNGVVVRLFTSVFLLKMSVCEYECVYVSFSVFILFAYDVQSKQVVGS